MVRMMSLPAPLERRVQIIGPEAAATPVTARNFRREILPRFVRSIMVSPSGVVGIVVGRSRITRASRVSSGPPRVEPILEALPAGHERHDGQTPGVKRYWRDRGHRPTQIGCRRAERAVGEQ